MNKNIVSVIAVIIVIAGGWYLLSNKTEQPQANEVRGNDATVAIVNGTEITQAELTRTEEQLAQSQGTTTASLSAEAKAELEDRALEALITQTLVRQAVESSGLTAAAADIEGQIAEIKKQFKTEAEYSAALLQENLTEEQLREQVGERMVTDAYLSANLDLDDITVTDAEIEAYYQESIKGSPVFPQLEEVKEQIRGMVLQQKQQAKFMEHVEKLKAEAEVEVLI